MRAVLSSVIVACALGACADREQVADGNRSYQGKRDSQPWDNAPLAGEYRGGKWTKGDRASWETGIRARQAMQSESKRIGH